MSDAGGVVRGGGDGATGRGLSFSRRASSVHGWERVSFSVGEGLNEDDEENNVEGRHKQEGKKEEPLAMGPPPLTEDLTD